jgi:hypothetical protein
MSYRVYSKAASFALKVAHAAAGNQEKKENK